MTSFCAGCWGTAGGLCAPAVLRPPRNDVGAQAPAAAFPGVRWLRGSRPSAPRGQHAAPLPRLFSSCQEHLEGGRPLPRHFGCPRRMRRNCCTPLQGQAAAHGPPGIYWGFVGVPLLILLAFAMGHLLGKHRARSQMTTAPAPNLAWQEGMNTTAHVRTTRDHANTNIGSTSHGTEETHGDNTEMRHDVHHVGKARIPSDTHAQTIVGLAQISFTDGKNRGRTFEEVWNNDHDNGYKSWLQKRLHDIDIVYPAFVVYAELMESLQRRPSWRVHQNEGFAAFCL